MLFYGMSSIRRKMRNFRQNYFHPSLVGSTCDQNKNDLSQNRGTHLALHSYVGTR